uniref:Tryptophan synthase alpha chain n=1 Tax=Lympha mucosa TaxID=2045360 RepID=A0A6B9VPK0_9FLOR|nr:Tryptophan synthase alpha subunit [Lympha mucosa]
MKSISQSLISLGNQRALIPFITAGNPDLYSTKEVLKILDKEGADIIELGVPYSDPLADGPIIQEASRKALACGVTLDKILHLVTEISPTLHAPLILFTYYNPILSRGMERFLIDIANAGIKGLIIPDLPLEESDYIRNLCLELSVELILLVTPASSNDRISSILSKASNVIYLVSTVGVTGIRKEVHKEMEDFIIKIKSKTNKLLILGFGISTIEHVHLVSKWDINGVVIGSAFVRHLSQRDIENKFNNLKNFCHSVKKVLTST